MLRNRLFALVFAFLGATLCGCGATFNSVAMNMPLPSNLKSRSIWPDTALIQYRLDLLAGHVLVGKEGAEFRRSLRVLKDGYVLKEETVKDGQVYQSKIDSTAAGKGKAAVPILSFASELKSDQRFEVVITDATMMVVSPDDVPADKLLAEAAKPKQPGERRVWVQAVMLTQVIKRLHTKVAANAVVTGATFGSDGSVFSETGIFQREPMVTMILVDIDDYSQAVADLSTPRVGAAWNPPGFEQPAKVLSLDEAKKVALEFSNTAMSLQISNASLR